MEFPNEFEDSEFFIIMLEEIKSELRKYVDKTYLVQRFFKEKTDFLQVRVPNIRLVAKKYANVDLEIVEALLKCKFHEERGLGLIIMANAYKKDIQVNKQIFEIYMRNLDAVNTWALVDVSAHLIVGRYVYDNPELGDGVLKDLASRQPINEIRIGIVATLWMVRKGRYNLALETLGVAHLHQNHLICQAVGWVVREIGKKKASKMREFLDQYIQVLPKITVRNIIQKMDGIEKSFWLERMEQ